MRIAYFDCYSGISGDMTLGAFLDAGLDFKILSHELKKLRLKGYEIKARKVMRGALTGTKFDCIVKNSSHAERPLKEIVKMIDKSSLNKKVREMAIGIFTTIGRAEARVHGAKSYKDAEFHELGQIDSIVDIVGTAIAVDELGINKFYSSGVNLGWGIGRAGHGPIPLPGPAALEILKGTPVRISDIEAELVTPTGAGILKSLCTGFGKMPEMRISDIGYGAGSMILKKLPNMLRVIIGEKDGLCA